MSHQVKRQTTCFPQSLLTLKGATRCYFAVCISESTSKHRGLERLCEADVEHRKTCTGMSSAVNYIKTFVDVVFAGFFVNTALIIKYCFYSFIRYTAKNKFRPNTVDFIPKMEFFCMRHTLFKI